MNAKDDMKQYKFQREHDRYNTASWSEPRWQSLLKIAGAMTGAVAMVAIFWLLTTGLFLL